MFRHVIFIFAILIASNSYASNEDVLAKLKARELEHKCEIVKRLQNSESDSPEQKAQRKQELESLQKELAKLGKGKAC